MSKSILEARKLQATQKRIMSMQASYKFRLNAVITFDCRKGKVWE